MNKLTGSVRQYDTATGRELLNKSNLVVDSALELILLSLLNRQHLGVILFAFRDGVPVVPTIRTLASPVGIAPLNLPASKVLQDDSGHRTIAVVGATLVPTGTVTYDTLALASDRGLVYSAVNLDEARTVDAPITTEWTIYL